MNWLAVSQRVEICASSSERRDALDQRWHVFFEKCGLIPLLIPNKPEWMGHYLEQGQIKGILLTGGNDLQSCGGSTPERDETEKILINFSLQKRIPLLGVCRGMQMIQDFFGLPLYPVEGHVAEKQIIWANKNKREVNSYHNFGTNQNLPVFDIWAQADDGIIKAIHHRDHLISGIMWHPERMSPTPEIELTFFKDFFGACIE